MEKHELVEGSWVIILQGMYKGDFAKVEEVYSRDKEVLVRLSNNSKIKFYKFDQVRHNRDQ